MQHECRITVLETKCFPDLQEKYLADPKSGPCPFFKPGDTFLLKRTPTQDDFYHLMDGKFCGEAWDAVNRYVYTGEIKLHPLAISNLHPRAHAAPISLH